MTTVALAWAGMSPDLKKRIAVAIPGVAILLALIIWGRELGIFLIEVVLSLAMINEFARITFNLPDEKEKRYILLFAGWFIAIDSLLLARTEFETLIFVFICLFVYFLFTARRYVEHEDFTTHFKELMFSLFGLVYLAFLPTYFAKIHGSNNGVHWMIVFLLLNWANDIGAYFAGRRYGKTKLYELISPKKTREGAIGGLASGLLAVLLYKLIFFSAMGWSAVIFVSLFVGVACQVGDFCESFFKRAFDKKDSGSLLPGHGGFLDRFDGVVFSLPIMYACTRIFI
jgi:phosphatidate cytidylyltransferase